MAVNGSNYFTVTVDSTKVDANITDFPVYVNLGDLATSHNFWSNVKTDGADIRVTKSDGTTEVPFELVSIDTVAETGELHFKADGTLSSTSDTEYRVYYNSTDTAYAATATYGRNNVWSDYQAVYHLNEDPSGTSPQMIDSTGNQDGTSSGSMSSADLVSSQINNGLEFDGTDDSIDISPQDISAQTDIVISAWVNNPTASTSRQGFISWNESGSFGEIGLATQSSNPDTNVELRVGNGSTINSVSASYSIDTWYLYHGLVYEGDKLELFVDGVSQGTPGFGTKGPSDQNDVQIGNWARVNDYTDATIDEVRIYFGQLSSDWIATEYNNQNSSSTFYTLSAEQGVSTSTPTVTTSAASVSGEDATLNGEITADGGASITERGFYYGTSSGNLSVKVVEGGTAVSTFSDTVEGLADDTYYFEAFATNADGEARGSELTFTISADRLPQVLTKSSTVSGDSATLNGVVLDDGGVSLTERGFYYSTTSGDLTTKVTEGGTAADAFSDTITSLADDTYYFEAFATNSEGEARGSELSFTTESDAPPTVTTNSSSVVGSDVTLSGTILSDRGASITERGFYYGTTSGSLGTKVTEGGTALGQFSDTVTGLTDGTYYFEAFATNVEGESRGDELSFVVDTTVAPDVDTIAASSVSGDTSTLNGEVTADNGESIIERGFYYGTTSGSLGTKVVEGGTSTGLFSEGLTGLADDTYYFEAFATNVGGESRGSELSFTIDTTTKPVVQTNPASVTGLDATLNGEVVDNGGNAITDQGFYYGTSLNDITTKISDTSPFSSPFSDTVTLAGGEYYVRAFATNSKGESKGVTLGFIVIDTPTVTTDSSAVTDDNVELTGTITNGGGANITERGFYYGTTSGSLGTKLVEGGTATGEFSDSIESLADDTYYYEAFATNSEGESRGSELSFTIPDQTDLRAVWEQENNFGVTDRIEIYDSEFSGTALEFVGRAPCAFDFSHRETTSQQREYLSIFENQILMGVMDLYLRVDSTAKETFFEDIADAPSKRFRLEWKRDGETVWYGYPHGRVVQYDDKPEYNYKIQFRDFEILKGIDYPISNDRQLIWRTIVDIWDELSFPLFGSTLVKTATSWEVEGSSLTNDDFLNLIYHDTTPLRDFTSGTAEAQPISYYEALERVIDPMLICYQWKGLNVYQISALKDPTNVDVGTYRFSQISYTENEDLSQQIYTKTADGSPTSKVTSPNTSYPAIRQASYEFKHQSGSTRFEFDTKGEFPPIVDFDGENHYVSSKSFTGSGDERLNFLASYSTTSQDLLATYAVAFSEYALDSDYEFRTAENHSGYASNGTSSVNTTNGRLNLFADNYVVGDPVMLYTGGTLPTGLETEEVYYIIDKNDSDDWIQISATPDGEAVIPSDTGTGSVFVRVIKLEQETVVSLASYEAVVSFISGDIPTVSETDIEVILIKTGDGLQNESWRTPNIFIEDPTAAGESSRFRLTQDALYPDSFEMKDSYYGDGPYSFSSSSFRLTLSLSDITEGWRRKGEASYVSYSNLKLREVIDYQRVRQLKKTFPLWGEFDPSKVAVFQSENFMYVGGTYDGRWKLITVKIDENLDA